MGESRTLTHIYILLGDAESHNLRFCGIERNTVNNNECIKYTMLIIALWICSSGIACAMSRISKRLDYAESRESQQFIATFSTWPIDTTRIIIDISNCRSLYCRWDGFDACVWFQRYTQPGKYATYLQLELSSLYRTVGHCTVGKTDLMFLIQAIHAAR
jgi:hypothetical protein